MGWRHQGLDLEGKGNAQTSLHGDEDGEVATRSGEDNSEDTWGNNIVVFRRLFGLYKEDTINILHHLLIVIFRFISPGAYYRLKL